jgi:hypothetical protein
MILFEMTKRAFLLEAVVYPLDETTALNNEAVLYLISVLANHYLKYLLTLFVRR